MLTFGRGAVARRRRRGGGRHGRERGGGKKKKGGGMRGMIKSRDGIYKYEDIITDVCRSVLAIKSLIPLELTKELVSTLSWVVVHGYVNLECRIMDILRNTEGLLV